MAHKTVKTILVSQPKPQGEKSSYFDLAEKYNLKIDFRPFIHVAGVDVQEFRDQRVDFKEFTAIILTSKTAVDHFFKMAEATRFQILDTLKYFCMSETIALYLQKYVTYRKRKIFFGKQTIEDLAEVMKKHKNEKFLLPSSDILRDRIPEVLEKYGYNFKRAILYRTVSSDLSDLEDVFYDILVFFSPADIESLFKNFPDFKQNDTLIAAYGNSTTKALEDHKLRVDIHASPQEEFTSMTAAIEGYIKKKK